MHTVARGLAGIFDNLSARRLASLMGGDLTYQRQDPETIFELTLPGPQAATESLEGLGKRSDRPE